jgi:hypothetical protein
MCFAPPKKKKKKRKEEKIETYPLTTKLDHAMEEIKMMVKENIREE